MPVTIRPFKPGDQPVFERLNLDWIEQHFVVEPSDRMQLGDPQTQIIDPGGAVFMAEVDGDVVGTVGLVAQQGRDSVELIKMAVRDDARGQGVGSILMEAVIAQARQFGASQIWLETNTVLDQAVRLYKKFGFRVLADSECVQTPYERCNCQMVMELG
ncbi:MAG: GNAT family N-acetyltransferase [Planctomycetota bacterium]